MKHRLIIFLITLIIVLSTISISYSEKICPVDGEIFPDDYNFCTIHGVPLEYRPPPTERKPVAPKQSVQKIYIFYDGGKKKVMEFKGFNTDCNGYGNEGIKYTEKGITIKIPWDDVKHILPVYSKAYLNNGHSIESDAFKPENCSKAYTSEIVEKKVIIAGYEKTKKIETKIMLYNIEVIAFSEKNLNEGRMYLDNVEKAKSLKIKYKKKAGELAGEMVFVKGGCFQMGDIFGDGESDEKPVHETCVDDFYIGQYEVTQWQWEKVMGNNPSRFKGGDNYPVDSVSWDDVQEFIQRLNQISSMGYRLPTEAEWEYACRNGGKNVKFPWGQDNPVCLKDSKKGAKFDDNGICDGTGPEPVGSYGQNALGLYDMSGNVWEWVQDVYSKTYMSHSQDNPAYTESTSLRVERGGSWVSEWRHQRCAARDYYLPADGSSVLGFRIVMDEQN